MDELAVHAPPVVAEVDELAVHAPPVVAEVDALAVHAPPVVAEVDELAAHAPPAAEVDELAVFVHPPRASAGAEAGADPAREPPHPIAGDLRVEEVWIAVEPGLQRLASL